MMLEAMRDAHIKATTGYMQCGQPSPELEWLMNPADLKDLRIEVGSSLSTLGLFLQQRADGVWEFMHHAIRLDSSQIGWKLQPAASDASAYG